MKAVKIEDVPESGLHLDEALGIDFINEIVPSNQDFAPTRVGNAKLFLQKQGSNIVLSGKAEVELRCVCASCLKDTRVSLQPEIDLVLFKSAPELVGKDVLDNKKLSAKKPAAKDGSRTHKSDQKTSKKAIKNEALGDEDWGEMLASDGESEGTGEYDGRVVDWPAIVREHLLLAMPLAPRCSDACKGLCPACGCDRNEIACQCEIRQMDPRWAKLKQLKLDSN